MTSALRFLCSSAAAVLLVVPSHAVGQKPSPVQSTHDTQAATQSGKVWSYTGSVWDPVDVSIGNRGTQVFVGLFHNLWVDSHAMLLSSHDGDPATPCWKSPLGGEATLHSASAALTDVHVIITEEEAGGANERIRRVERFSSKGLDWVYTYPQLGAGKGVIGVSNDGSVIVASVGNPTTGWNDVLVFGPDSPVPVQTFTVPTGTLWGFDLAAQGTRAVFAIQSAFHVLDLVDGTVHTIYDQSPYAVSLMGVAISGDGSVVGCNVANGVALFEWNGADYVQTWFHDFPGSVRVDVSEDGSTLAYGTGSGWGVPHIVTECMDVPSKTVTMSEDLVGTGQYGNWIEDVSVSADGSRFATASWGDELDLVPEVRIYSKHDGTPIQTLNLPGSAVTVDISRDGQWIASGSRPVHVELPSIGGRVDLFRVGGSDFAMRTVPKIGSTVTFEVFGQPGRKAYVLDSPQKIGRAHV
jgi:hypothetical protein